MWSASGVTEIRRACGMTVSALAEKASASRVTIYAVERGELAELGTLVRVAGALDVPLARIAPDAAKMLEGVA